jgi:anaerobic selenocysteine-containing dehydrogenase
MNKKQEKLRQSRRDFLAGVARLGTLGVLGGGAAALALRNKSTALGNQQCNNQGICSGCGVFNQCGLPAALSAKAAGVKE